MAKLNADQFGVETVAAHELKGGEQALGLFGKTYTILSAQKHDDHHVVVDTEGFGSHVYHKNTPFTLRTS